VGSYAFFMMYLLFRRR
jgi:hypothetical protein